VICIAGRCSLNTQSKVIIGITNFNFSISNYQMPLNLELLIIVEVKT
jgi:hypothetical protein